jgi:hypothetical protein
VDHHGRIGQPVFFGAFNHTIDAKGRTALPANIDTILVYVTWLASGRDTNNPLSISSIEVALASIKKYLRTAGYPFDEKDPHLFTLMKGVRRELAKPLNNRKTLPIWRASIKSFRCERRGRGQVNRR